MPIALFLCLAALPIAGCGGDLPETVPVEGRVTLDGEPVSTGTIMYFPSQGRPAAGVIGADGTYRLTTFVKDDGAIIGSHTVTIQADEVSGGDNPASYFDEIKGVQFGELRPIVPGKYNARATSGLTAEVKAQPKPNRIDFDLPK